MPDIYFTCKTCGKCLVADDSLTGSSTICPDCNLSVIVPTMVIVHPCPHCGQKLKFTADLKGEVVDCTACKGEVFLPGLSNDDAPAIRAGRLVDYACPKCGAEIEALEELAGRMSGCPNCGTEVRLRKKLHLRLAPSLVADSPAPSGDAAPEPSGPVKWRRLSSLLRYGVVDLLLLVLMCIPLPALDGHSFFYILKLSISGSKFVPSDPGQSRSSDARPDDPVRSEAWHRGYEAGQAYGKMDVSTARVDYRDPSFTVRARLAAGYSEGTTDYSDFWDGYRRGYSDPR